MLHLKKNDDSFYHKTFKDTLNQSNESKSENMEKYVREQLDNSYNGQLNTLFEKWKASYPAEADAENRFCKDGLVIKHKEPNSGYDVNAEWDKSPRKIMFLVKDCPDGWGYDTRTLLTGYEEDKESLKRAENTRNLNAPFFKNLAKILYGLSYMTKDYLGEDLAEDIKDNNKLIQTFNEKPFAYVECKKMAGDKTCNNNILKSAMRRDKDFLIEEIKTLHPNIIVCCGGGNSIFDFVVTNYFHGKRPSEENQWEYDYVLDDGTKCNFHCSLYYYKEEGVLLFNSYHPSAIKGWKIHERVFNPFRRFFNQYGTFDIVSK